MFGGMLKGFRVQALLTQDELAAASGMSVRQIRELESGRVGAPRPSTVRVLAESLRLSPADREAFRRAAQSERDRRRTDAITAEADSEPPPARGDDTPVPETLDAPVPAQLPADIVGFTGRVRELAALDRGQAGLVVISGVAGVGKTALAVHWAQRAAARYPGGQLYVNLRGFHDADTALDPADAIRGFLDAFGVPPDRVPASREAQAALYRSLSADRRLLVVLDNARDADQVRPLLPGGPATRTIITSRRRLTSLIAETGAWPLTLDVPAPGEAVELLTRRIGPGGTDRGAVAAIADACGRLPLALAMVGARARLTGFPPIALATELRRPQGRLDALGAGDDRGVRAAFSWSYQALSPAAATLFRLLGLAAGPDIAAEAVAALAGRPLPHVRRTLSELADANLVIEHAPGRYQLHDLLRTYAGELAAAHEPDTARRAALTRLLDHYTHTAYRADLVLNPVRAPIPMALGTPADGAHPKVPIGVDAALAWLDTEHEVLLTALRQAEDEGMYTHAWQLSWALDTFLHEHRRWHDEGAAWAVALRAATAMTDRPAAAYAHRFLSAVNGRLDRFDEAHDHMSRAVELSRATGDRPGEAEAHYVLSYVYWLQGVMDRALDHAGQALSLYTEFDDPLWMGKANQAVGWYHAQLGHLEEALPYHHQALIEQQRSGDRANEAVAWDSLGVMYQYVGDHERAVHHYERGLQIARSLGDPVLEALLITHLGDAGEAVGDLETARERWLHAYRMLRALRHPQAADLRRKLRSVTPVEDGDDPLTAPGFRAE